MAIRALFAVVGILFVLVLVVGILPAGAHTETVSVDPADGSTTTTLPKAVTIRAADEVEAAQIIVTTPDARVEKLTVRVDGREVTAPMPSAGPRGEYSVAYRLVATDGHAITGATTFTVTQGAQADAEPVAAAPAESGVPAIGLSVGAVLLLVVGGMLVLAKVRR